MTDEEIAVRLTAAILVPAITTAQTPQDAHLRTFVQTAVVLYQAMLAEVRRVRS